MIKTRKRLIFLEGGAEVGRIETDKANNRMGVFIGGTEIARMTSSRFSILGDQAIGDSAADLIGFYGATPIVQPAATAQSTVASTTITTTPSTTITTTPTTAITSVGSTSLTAADVTRINALIARVEEIRVVQAAAVPRVEELRVVQAAHVSRTEAIRVLQNQTRTDLIALGLQKGSI